MLRHQCTPRSDGVSSGSVSVIPLGSHIPGTHGNKIIPALPTRKPFKLDGWELVYLISRPMFFLAGSLRRADIVPSHIRIHSCGFVTPTQNSGRRGRDDERVEFFKLQEVKLRPAVYIYP